MAVVRIQGGRGARGSFTRAGIAKWPRSAHDKSVVRRGFGAPIKTSVKRSASNCAELEPEWQASVSANEVLCVMRLDFLDVACKQCAAPPNCAACLPVNELEVVRSSQRRSM